MTNLQAQRTLQADYAEAGGLGELPWDKIIAALLNLFSGCTMAKAKKFVTDHPLAAKWLAANKIQSEVQGLTLNQRLKAAEIGVKFVTKTSVKSLSGIAA